MFDDRWSTVRAVGAALMWVAAWSAASPAFAQSPAEIRIPFVPHPPSIDEFTSGEPAPGRGLARVDALVQRAPADGAPVSERTEVYIGHDARHLYAVFVCFDSNPSAVRGHLVGRDRIPDDDDSIAIHLDTFRDRKNAYGFQVSASGVQQEGIWTEGASWDLSFDTIWTAESRRTPFGYVVSVAVPFASLRYPAATEHTWGLFVFRGIPRKAEQAFWPAYSSRDAGRLAHAAVATGIRGIVHEGGVLLTPYASLQGAGATVAPGTGSGTTAARAAGLDAKWVLRNSVVVDATVNPDFSQVESDEPQVTVNERFEKVFPEKRLFFLENAAYFQTPMPLLFTRRIVDPGAGVRVTGKHGRYSVAALVVDDDRRRASDPEASRAVYAVGRLRRGIGAEGAVGLFASAREQGHASNRVAGVDGAFRLGRHWGATWQGALAVTTEATGVTITGPAYTATLKRSGRSLTYVANWHDRGAGFRADAGFVPRVDFRSLDHTVSYRFRPGGGRLVAWGPELTVTRVWDRHGGVLDHAVMPALVFELAGPSTVKAFHRVGHERLRPSEVAGLARPIDIDAGRTGVEASVGVWSRLVWTAAVSRGSAANLNPAAGGTVSAADVLQASFTASARVAEGVSVDLTYLGTRLRDASVDQRIFANHIGRLKVAYQVSRALSARAIVQRQALDPNGSRTALGERSELLGDVLVTYLAAPGRAVHVGVNTYRNQHGPGARARGWQVFAKVSYAIGL
ncbi:MAG: DUF5916 domain-containing protein [Vicinamibacterales bacterium]|nr:DUF5916 domain-containing protein [Vicinamibacterales bacterium]